MHSISCLKYESMGVLEDLPHIKLYSAHVNSEHFWRELRLVVLHNEREDNYLVLCSTDVNQTPAKLVRFYRLCYQLEFIICDAKQHLGLNHCQAPSQAKLDYHLNLCIAAVNLGRFIAEHFSISLASLMRETCNTFLVEELLSKLSLDAEFGTRDPILTSVIQIGRISY